MQFQKSQHHGKSQKLALLQHLELDIREELHFLTALEFQHLQQEYILSELHHQQSY
jgi:hypothetical protein